MYKMRIVNAFCGLSCQLCTQQIKYSYRVSKYKKWENEFDEELNGIEYTVKLGDVSKFVRRTNISINVYCYSEGNIAPLELTTSGKDKHIDFCTLKIKMKIIIVGYKIWKN
jgi:phage host-nuclease inhibitor protein Gam